MSFFSPIPGEKRVGIRAGKSPLAAGRISEATLEILDRFHHPGFSAYEGAGVPAGDSAARQRLAPYGDAYASPASSTTQA